MNREKARYLSNGNPIATFDGRYLIKEQGIWQPDSLKFSSMELIFHT